MKKAIWNGVVIAESDATIMLEGNHYFPHEAIKKEFFKITNTQTFCPLKQGEASYYSIEVNGEINKDAAWYYPKVGGHYEGIKNHVAFWKGVEVK